MAEKPDKDRLKALETRIKAVRRTQVQPVSEGGADLSGAELAWRMVIELVTGLGIGVGIGYGLDALFGTIPLFLVLFTGLGFAAGVKVMLRTAKSVQEQVPDEARDEGD